MSHNIDKAYWVVFNPTAEDYTNSNETSETADKDILGIRVWLSKKAGSEAYNYVGKGNYTGGPIVDITPIFMSPADLSILAHSPRWDAASFATLKEGNSDYLVSETSFKDCFLQVLQSLLLQEDATPASISLAFTALSSVISNLLQLDLDNAYTALNDAAASGSFTAQIKTDMLSLISDYLKKFPR